MKRLILAALLFTAVSGWAQTLVGTGQTYPTLKSAFDAINSGTLTGTVVLQLTSSTTESATATLNASGGTANYSSVVVYPSGSGYTISGNLAGALIELNGAGNVVIDGRVNQTGNRDLTISNTSTGATASSILLINDATANTIKYCKITGCAASNGVVTFSTTNGSAGNDNNVVEQCEIRDGATKPKYLIHSSGTASKENSSNSVINCQLYNFNGATSTGAIYLASGNSQWTISGNSIYQTAAYAGSSTFVYGIFLGDGSGYQVSGNYIGGSAPLCGGGAWTINGTAAAMKFMGIQVNAGTIQTTTIQGNIIRNIYWLTNAVSTSSPGVWCGIHTASGNVNIGNPAGNIVGDSTGTGSITIVTTSTSNTYYYGIANLSTGASVHISNNSVGSITLGNGTATTALSALYCIHNSGGTAGTTVSVIENNLIGSHTTPNSIYYANPTTSTVNQFINGLYNNALGTATISGNTIANIRNNYAGAGSNANSICGIFIGGGSNTVTTNTVRNLTSSGTSAGTGIGTNLLGIFVRDIAAVTGNQIITGNKIHTLNNLAATAAVTICGIYFNGPSNASNNLITKNNIHNLTASTTGAANISGINISSSGTTNQVSNNMISLGDGLANSYLLNGIMDNAGTNDYYFNSVFIGGMAVTGASSTYAFQSNVTTNIRKFQNNIFVNGRSNGTGTGKHYAIRIAGTSTLPAGLTIDYNDYFTDGTGGVLGYYNGADKANLADWKIAIGLDNNSISADPQYVSTNDLHIQTAVTSPVSNAGTPIVSVTDDYDNDPRTNTPDIGADEFAGIPVINCAGTPSSSLILGPDSLCSGNSALLSLSTSYNFVGISYQWKYATAPGGPYLNLDTNATQTTGFLSANRYYTCTILCSYSGLSYTTPVKSLIVTPIPGAAITYPGSPYCQTDTALKSVNLTGTTGGIFTSVPAGLSLAAATGAVYPFTSQPGTYTVTYSVGASGGCSAFSTAFILNINAVPSATISYPGSPYCTSLSSIQPVTLTGTGGGTFSVAPAGLILNTNTGAITPGASTAGNYLVTYTMSSTGGCPSATTTAPVTITEMPFATISYSSTVFCTSITTPQPVTLTGTQGGTFNSLPGLSLNNSTGAINPSASTMGVYTVNYTIAAAGGCAAFTANSSVIINPVPQPAGIITSVNNDTVSTGANNVLFRVAPIPYATSYIWRYTGTGITFNPDSVTIADSVYINFGTNATSGVLTVRGYNACGPGDPSAGYPVIVTIGIEEYLPEPKIYISPNPSDGIFNLYYNNLPEDARIEVMTPEGRVIWHTLPDTAGMNHTVADLKAFAKGVYFIRVTGNHYTNTKKIILK